MKIEDWARVICQRELDQPVEPHDDGTAPGMYDLRVGAVVGPAVAIECVRAVDATLEELWNVGPIRGPLMLGLTGDWICTLTREARVKKRLLTSLERPPRDCEGRWSVGHPRRLGTWKSAPTPVQGVREFGNHLVAYIGAAPERPT